MDTLETRVGAYLAESLVPCPSRRQLLQRQQDRRRLILLGVGPGDRDEVADDGQQCTVLNNVAEGDCYFMQGTIILYVSSTDTMTNSEASDVVYAILNRTFNGDSTSNSTRSRSRLQEQTETFSFVDVSAGILALYFHGASVQSGGSAPNSTAPGSTSTSAPQADNSQAMEALGVAFIAAACVGVLLLSLIAMRRRATNMEKGSRGIELKDTDITESSPRLDKPAPSVLAWQSNSEDDDDDKYNYSVTSSLPAKVVDEDESSIFRDLDAEGGYIKEYINGTGVFDEGHEIKPKFVKADGDYYRSPSKYVPREYEIGDTVDM